MSTASRTSSRTLQLLTAVVVTSMVTCGVSAAGQTPASAPAAPSSTLVAGSAGNPADLSALTGDPASGPAVPVHSGSVVTESTGVATSTTPVLQATGTAAGQYQFTVAPLSTGAPASPVTLSASGPSVQVPAGALQEGDVYQWRASAPGAAAGDWHVFTVDSNRSGLAPVDSAGGVAVNEATGAVSTAWTSQSVSSAAGSARIGLSFHTGSNAQAGVPAGWSLTAGSGSGYQRLLVQPGGSVQTVSDSGVTVNYQGGPNRAYTPVWGTGQSAPSAALSTLVHNDDSTWTVSDPDGTTTVFTATTDQPSGAQPLTAQVTSVTKGGTPSFGQTVTDGVVGAVTDPVSGQQITLRYGPVSGQQLPSGFVPAPAGLLSGATFWDGSTVQVLYVDTPTGPQIGRLVADAQAGSDAQVTDYAYDAAGRLSAVRAPLSAAVLAAQIPGFRADQVETHLTYDGQGRAVAVTAPVAGAGQTPVTRHYAYAADGTSTTTTQDGTAPPAGFLTRVQVDPATLLPTATWDADGRKSTTTYDPATGHVLSTTTGDGSTTTTTYDPNTGWPVKVVGPVRGQAGPDAPTVTRAYDQVTTGESATSPGVTKDLRGLDVHYWANANTEGAPARTEIGPVNGSDVPDTMAMSWTQPPVNGDNGWSARLTGTWQVDTAGTYTVTAGPSGAASLWLDGQSCPGGTCSNVGLAAGPHTVRIDLRVPHPTPGAAGALTLSAAPAGSQPSPVPTDHLHPNLGRLSSTSSADATGPGTAATVTSHTDYDPAQLDRVTSNSSPSGLRYGTAFEPVDPAHGQFGRQTSTTSPGGDSVVLGSWGGNEQATVPGIDHPVNQAGLPKTVSDPTPGGGNTVTSTTTYDAAGRPAAVVTATASTTTAYDQIGRPATSSTTAAGKQTPDSTVTSQYAYQGNPLQTAVTSTTAEGTHTTVTQVDLAGRPTLQVDSWGTTTATTYDPATGQVAQAVTTTSPDGGAAPTVKTTTSTYNADGTPKTVSTSSQTSPAPAVTAAATLSYAANGDLTSIEYSNGAHTAYTTDAEGRTAKAVTTTSDGQTFTDSRTFSPANKVLTQVLDTPGHTATTDYHYDIDARLTGAELSTDQNVAHHSWAYTYDADGNRTSQDVDGKTYTYSYDPAGSRLTATDDPSVGAITYDAATGSQITGIGDTSLGYDPVGDLVSAADPTVAVAYTRDATGAVIARTTTPVGGQPTTVRMSDDGLELDSADHLLTDSETLPGGVTATTTGGATTWSFDDKQGNAWFTTDAAGHPTGTPTLTDPFGQALTTDVPSAGDPDMPGWQDGAGLQVIPTAHLALLQAGDRTYVPALGRFTTPDPQVGGSANRYDYANQDPINAGDPTGHSVTAEIVGTVIATVVLSVFFWWLGAPEIGSSAVSAEGAGAAVADDASRVAASVVGARGAEDAAVDVAGQAVTRSSWKVAQKFVGRAFYNLGKIGSYAMGAAGSGGFWGAATGAATGMIYNGSEQLTDWIIDGTSFDPASFGRSAWMGAAIGGGVGFLGRGALALRSNARFVRAMPLMPFTRSSVPIIRAMMG